MGENLRFVYSIGGQLLAEFSGVGGTLLKEYIYGAQGLLATIEPTAVNANGTRYTTADHLGSPRVVTNSTAGLVSRHHYMPFGEELSAGMGGRTTAMGFPGSSDGLRQKFTAKERDSETGLDYSIHRYYSSAQGRFTSPDVPFADQWETDPQSWNLYAYVGNSPRNATDPFGLWKKVDCDNGGQCWQAEDGDTWATLAWDAGIGGHTAIGGSLSGGLLLNGNNHCWG